MTASPGGSGSAAVRKLSAAVGRGLRHPAVRGARTRLARNPVIRRLAGRPALGRSFSAAARREGLHVAAGLHLPPDSVDGLAVVLVILLGLDGQRLDDCVERVAEQQVMLQSFAPLFLVDSDHFEPLRRHGYLFEYVPPRADWEALGDGSAWSIFLARRLRALVDTYAPATIVSVHGDRADRPQDAGHLSALLAAVTSDPHETDRRP